MAEAIRTRRGELNLSQEAMSKKGGLGVATIGRVERCEIDPRATTYAGLDRAADWPAGTAKAIAEERASTPTTVSVEASAPKELTSDDRQRIATMSLSDVTDFALRLEQTSEEAAWFWLLEAARVKTAHIAPQSPQRSPL